MVVVKLYFALGSMLALCASASANLLTNGNFEASAFSSPYSTLDGTPGYTLPGWAIIGPNVAGIKSPYLSAPNQEVDLSGVIDTTPGTTGIAQSLTTIVGKKYFLKFDVFAGTLATGGYAGGVDYFLNNSQFGTDLEGNRSTFSYSFIGTGSDTLRFMSHEGNVSHIDNVIVSTPAPGAMIAFGLSAVGARVRRRRSAK